MNAMDIYVQSCGLHPKQDYCWLKIVQTDDHLPDNPPLLVQVEDENGQSGLITDFYYSETPSIVLAKGQDRSILVITALLAGDRSKLYGRTIRNSIAIVSPKTELLQKIAARAAQNWDDFTDRIDRAVNFDDESGFKVDLPQIKSYLDNNNESSQTLDDLTKIIEIIELNIAEEVKKKRPKIMLILQIIAAIALILIIVFLWSERVN
ncbi:MAG: hypothetical protein QNJ38_24815 [Prochloraceae cyanobacterium]|nr:hypothetical protein [Prochloraceae cyanobacterium]